MLDHVYVWMESVAQAGPEQRVLGAAGESQAPAGESQAPADFSANVGGGEDWQLTRFLLATETMFAWFETVVTVF